MKDFRRDVTVLVCSIKGLKNIITWYVLRLASEGILVYDKGNIKELFKKMIATARKAGFVEKEIGPHKVWSAPNLKLGERLAIRVED